MNSMIGICNPHSMNKNSEINKSMLLSSMHKKEEIFFWYGTPINAQPEPSFLQEFSSNNIGILVNSADILSKQKIKDKILENNLKNFLNYNGKIMLDSGGFLFQKRNEINIKMKELLFLYKKAKPDVCVALDHPIDPKLSYHQNYKRRIKSLKNLEIMVKENLDSELIPVIHGYSFLQLRNFSKKVKEIYKDNTNCDPKWIGLGSMVPLLKLSHGVGSIPRDSNRTSLNSVEFLFAAIAYIKKLFPKSFLHVFGVGGTTTMQLVYASGADSLDSVGWRLKAAHGAIQMLGLSDRFLSPRKNKSRKVLEVEYRKNFEECKCGIKPHTLEQLDNSFTLRAKHNAFVYSQVFQSIQNLNLMDDQNVYEIEDKLKTSPLKKYIPFIIKLRNGYFNSCKKI
ncbi:MAG: hypothetical protein ACTSP3_04435 [Candidatus Heimdallarchaeaceae archaeon]